MVRVSRSILSWRWVSLVRLKRGGCNPSYPSTEPSEMEETTLDTPSEPKPYSTKGPVCLF